MKYKVGDMTLLGEITERYQKINGDWVYYIGAPLVGSWFTESKIDAIIVKPKRNIDHLIELVEAYDIKETEKFIQDNQLNSSWGFWQGMLNPYTESSKYPQLTPEELRAVKWLVDGGCTEMYGSGQEINFAVGDITFDAVRNGSTTLPIFKCFQLKKWYNSRTINLTELLAAQEEK